VPTRVPMGIEVQVFAKEKVNHRTCAAVTSKRAQDVQPHPARKCTRKCKQKSEMEVE
ncbi:hypothetical protein RUM43_009769, partial [Polyplax serrata]